MKADGGTIGIVRTADFPSIVHETLLKLGYARGRPASLRVLQSGAWMTLIQRIIGNSWVARHFSHESYLHLPSGANDDACLRYESKLFHVAQTLYEVHDLENIASRLERMSGQELEARFTELAIVACMRRANMPIWLRPDNSGVPSVPNYEADAMLDDQTMIAVEVKCRVERTALGKEGIVDRIREARRQLPSDKPCIVWVRIPGVWFSLHAPKDIDTVIAEAGREVFRNSKRISALIFIWEQRESASMQMDGLVNPVIMFQAAFTLLNEQARHLPEALRRALHRLTSVRTAAKGVLVDEVGRAYKEIAPT